MQAMTFSQIKLNPKQNKKCVHQQKKTTPKTE